MKSISIALATYNGSKFIQEQLESLAAQTVLPIELVVTDDASTDATVDIVQKFAETAPFPVRFQVNSENLGYKKNFLKCANLCRGDLIALCDQDDIWLPTKIEMISRIMRDEILMAFHNVEVFKRGQTLGYLYQIKDCRSYLPRGAKFFTFAPWGMSIVFDRSMLAYVDLHASSRDPDRIGVTESHDQWLHFLAAVLGSVSYTKQVLARYRQHDRNAIGWGRDSLVGNLARNLAESTLRTQSLLDCVRARILAINEIARRSTFNVAESAYFANLIEVERVLSFRRDVYRCTEFLGRSRAIYELARLGVYTTRDNAGIGAKGFLKDATVGLFLSQILNG